MSVYCPAVRGAVVCMRMWVERGDGSSRIFLFVKVRGCDDRFIMWDALLMTNKGAE